MDDAVDINRERLIIRAQGRDREASRSISLSGVVVGFGLLVAFVASANDRNAEHSGRLSAAMLEAILFLVAAVTFQVSWGRYVQGARTDRMATPGHREPTRAEEEKAKRKPLRIAGWALTLLPILLAGWVFAACGFRLHRGGGAVVTAPSAGNALTAVWVAYALAVACSVGAAYFAWRTRRLPRPESQLSIDKDPRSDTCPARAVVPSARRAPGTSSSAPTGDGQPQVPDTPLVLAFSGGGIRSASYCLGGFNALQGSHNGLTQLDSVVAVSGGSYTAAALSLTRSYSAGPVDLADVYSLRSPELAYLRRNSRYIFQPWWRTLSGIWQMVGGAVLNLFLAVAALRFIAWVLGWYNPAVGILTSLDTSTPHVNLWRATWPDWLLASGPWFLPLVGIAALLVVQFVRRGVQGGRIGRPSAAWWARSMAACSRIAVLAALALILVPAVIVGASRLSYTNQPTATVARAIANLGFTRPAACSDALTASADSAHERAANQAQVQGKSATESYGACGAKGSVTVAATGQDSYDPAQAVAAAGGVPGKSGVSGQLMAVIAIVGAALGSLKRAFSVVGKGLGKRGAKVRQALLVRLPQAALALLALWLVTLWSYQYSISPVTQASVVGPLIIAAGIILQLVNPNLTSMHEFYRERLSSAFAVGRDNQTPPVADNLPYKDRYTLSGLVKEPELVICTTANVNDQRVVPTRRFGVPMSLSPELVRLESEGVLPDLGYQDTQAVEQDPRGPALSVMGAVAMSGAAVSPMMGRMGAKVAPFRLLLTLFNIRLGVWVMNPRWPLGEADAPSLAPMSTNPRFHQLFAEAFGSTLVDDRWLYLTDGGHLDNLGLVEAVRRLPGKVLALSASNDPPGTWQDVGAAVSVIRADLGIDLHVTRRDEKSDTWVLLESDPTASGGNAMQVLVVKASLGKDKGPLDGVPVDVSAYSTRDGTFPYTSTGRQDFGDLEFESYRRLGQYLVQRALAQVPEFGVAVTAPAVPLVDPPSPTAPAAGANGTGHADLTALDTSKGAGV